jgi:hypothetical protein
LAPLAAGSAVETRRRVRELLDIPDEAVVFVISEVHTDRPGLVGVLRGIARCRQGRAGDPIAVIAGRKTHTIRRACDEAQIGRSVRIIGGTRQMAHLLAAADAAIAYGHSGEVGRTGRFIADALRMGRPVVMSAGAIGAELVRGDITGDTSAGLALTDTSSAGWAAGIATASGHAWRAIAAARAAQIGSRLGLDAMAARIEGELSKAVPAGAESRGSR